MKYAVYASWEETAHLIKETIIWNAQCLLKSRMLRVSYLNHKGVLCCLHQYGSFQSTVVEL